MSKKFFSLQSLYKESYGSLFFTKAKAYDIEVLSPEHQRSIILLVKHIEKTVIYQYVVNQNHAITGDDENFSHKKESGQFSKKWTKHSEYSQKFFVFQKIFYVFYNFVSNF